MLRQLDLNLNYEKTFMIALPSIAFGGFSGSAKGVTARYTDGRSVLSLRSHPTGTATAIQVARRASLSKISKSWRNLTDEQMAAWESLSEHFTGASSLGTKVKLSGFNLYVRLNSNRIMAGNSILSDAPAAVSALPEVSYSEIWVTPSTLVIKDIVSQDSPLKLVVKMSAPQSSGVSSGWSKTVIVSHGLSDDWGDVDMTMLYFSTIGVYPTVGQKVLVEMYWLDTETGLTGVSALDSMICMSE